MFKTIEAPNSAEVACLAIWPQQWIENPSNIGAITRAGALFPFYRTSSLLEQLKGKIEVPAVLFYPGELDGAAGLRFMGVLDAEHNYRPKIF